MALDVVQHPIIIIQIHLCPTLQLFKTLIFSNSSMLPKQANNLRNLLKQVSAIDRQEGGLAAEDLLDTCEKIDPSKFIGTGGALFETFIMVFGSEKDSSMIRTQLNPRPRGEYKMDEKDTKEKITQMIKTYTLRFVLIKLVFSLSFS